MSEASRAGENPISDPDGQQTGVGGGNPELEPETADTWTAGLRRPDATLVILFFSDRDDESADNED